METIEKISGYLLKSKCREIEQNGLKLEVKGPFLEYPLMPKASEYAGLKMKILNCEYGLINGEIVKIKELRMDYTRGLSNFDYITLDLLTEITGKDVTDKNFSKEKINLIADKIKLNPSNKDLRTLLRLQAMSNNWELWLTLKVPKEALWKWIDKLNNPKKIVFQNPQLNFLLLITQLKVVPSYYQKRKN